MRRVFRTRAAPGVPRAERGPPHADAPPRARLPPPRGRHDREERDGQQELDERDLRAEGERRLARDELGGRPEDRERSKPRGLREPVEHRDDQAAAKENDRYRET